MNPNNELQMPLQLPIAPPRLIRDNYFPDIPRARVADEKYFRQRSRPGFIDITSYANFETVMECDENILYPHAYEIWAHYGDTFYKTDRFKVVNLATEITLPDWIYDHETKRLSLNPLFTIASEHEEAKCRTCNRQITGLCRENRCTIIIQPVEGDLIRPLQ